MTRKTNDTKSDEAVAELFLNDLNNLVYFEDLILRYEPKLLRYVRSLGVEQNLAYDVVQDCFIKAYRNIRSFNPKKGKWSSWIYRIAHNCAMDSFKKSKKDLTVDEDEWWDSISVPETITEELNIKLNNENLMYGLRKVDLKYREPLTLYYLENKSYKEIGDILRMPVPTVSTRIKRGKDKLKEVINNDLMAKDNLKVKKMEEVI
ncbi:MAG: RNA polymerase sigma factor [Candidatus Nomurabacteria bacterium]|nr:MAG: RNA polymerase sigma factor [Candidatus Nomurabacteria bacterium]HRV76043.1 RNA polymerase sigma factor [Candidatus Saccharimonadales bacterium]